eukprot:2052421-Alexandrium_andersonii.AAC.1
MPAAIVAALVSALEAVGRAIGPENVFEFKGYADIRREQAVRLFDITKNRFLLLEIAQAMIQCGAGKIKPTEFQEAAEGFVVQHPSAMKNSKHGTKA